MLQHPMQPMKPSGGRKSETVLSEHWKYHADDQKSQTIVGCSVCVFAYIEVRSRELHRA